MFNTYVAYNEPAFKLFDHSCLLKFYPYIPRSCETNHRALSPGRGAPLHLRTTYSTWKTVPRPDLTTPHASHGKISN